MTVRSPTAADRDALLGLMDAYIEFYESPRLPRERLDALADVLSEGKEGQQLVAEDGDGALVGFATLYYTWSTLRADRISIMNDLYVEEGARGSGAAAALFQGARAASKAAGCVEMEWQTATTNHRAQAFYAKMGGTQGDWLSYSID
jgi:GNAT superfamily N-acetyltransferase